MTDMVRFLSKRLGTRPSVDVDDAKRAWSEFRVRMGWGPTAPLLSPPSSNLKLRKDGRFPTYGLSLAPSDAAGDNVCRFATKECRAGCVAYSGNGLYPKVGQARMLKNAWLREQPEHFATLLYDEVYEGPAYDSHVRLNTFSDIPWERVAPWLIEEPGGFYDYTKWPDRETTDMYNLTYSASENTTDAHIHDMLPRMNVAVVFDTVRGHDLPAEYLGVQVIDGDKTDARWLDPRPAIVGLRAKGRMRQDIARWRMVRPSGRVIG